MKTLIIDCYDSFTYNLYQLIGELDGNPYVVKKDHKTGLIKKDFDRIVLSPGPGRPKNTGICSKAIDLFDVPILGVCLGHQVIASKFGAGIEKTEPVHGKVSTIEHYGTDLFDGVPRRFKSARYHSLIVSNFNGSRNSNFNFNCKHSPSTDSKSDEPVERLDKLEVTARSCENDMIMGVSHKKKEIHGIQFHPESIVSKYGRKILKNFLSLDSDQN